jgi:hypothetical protein
MEEGQNLIVGYFLILMQSLSPFLSLLNPMSMGPKLKFHTQSILSVKIHSISKFKSISHTKILQYQSKFLRE